MADQLTPQAVEAVALYLIRDEVFMRPRASKQVAADVLLFVRDAIHRDGDDADAIRETLGLDWAFAQFGADGEPRWRQVASKWQEVQP